MGEHLGTVDLTRDALGYDWSQLFDFSKRHLTSALGDVTHALRHPRETVTETIATGQSIARFVEPVTDTLSPLMIERRARGTTTCSSSTWRTCWTPRMQRRRQAQRYFVSGVTAGLLRFTNGTTRGSTSSGSRCRSASARRMIRSAATRITLLRFKVPSMSPTRASGWPRPTVAAPIRQDRSVAALHERDRRYTEPVPRSSIIGMLKHIDFLASNVPEPHNRSTSSARRSTASLASVRRSAPP